MHFEFTVRSVFSLPVFPVIESTSSKRSRVEFSPFLRFQPTRKNIKKRSRQEKEKRKSFLLYDAFVHFFRHSFEAPRSSSSLARNLKLILNPNPQLKKRKKPSLGKVTWKRERRRPFSSSRKGDEGWLTDWRPEPNEWEGGRRKLENNFLSLLRFFSGPIIRSSNKLWLGFCRSTEMRLLYRQSSRFLSRRYAVIFPSFDYPTRKRKNIYFLCRSITHRCFDPNRRNNFFTSYVYERWKEGCMCFAFLVCPTRTSCRSKMTTKQPNYRNVMSFQPNDRPRTWSTLLFIQLRKHLFLWLSVVFRTAGCQDERHSGDPRLWRWRRRLWLQFVA